MRAPAFWWTTPERPAPLARVLAPLGRAYAAATARRLQSVTPVSVARPVICAGNLVVGGSGKTPVVIALAERLIARGRSVAVVSRGYGGSLAGPVRVDETRHTSGEVGDEPLLISAFAPVWVGRDRVGAARAAVGDGADVILLDDGFQDPALSKDYGIVVADAARGFGNARCIPAGPLREPVETGLGRADLLLVVGEPRARERFLDRWRTAIPCPVAEAELRPLDTGMEWEGARLLAFAGIGDPARFFATLAGLGADVRQTVALDDHQPIPPALLSRLREDAARLGAELVTTEKDAMRLPRAERGGILTLPVRLHVEDWSAIDARLAALGL